VPRSGRYGEEGSILVVAFHPSTDVDPALPGGLDKGDDPYTDQK
jgi:hypothetical protein